MKIFISFCLFVITCFSVRCQSVTKSIYEAGTLLTGCEVNFKNLFANWNSSNITNASDLILINYAFVETIADTTAIDLYSKAVTSNKSIAGTVKHSYASGSGMQPKSEQVVSVRTLESLCDTTGVPPEKAMMILKMFAIEQEEMRKGFKSFISVGDKVYALFFRDRQQIYSSFVFCDARTNKVKYDPVFGDVKKLEL